MDEGGEMGGWIKCDMRDKRRPGMLGKREQSRIVRLHHDLLPNQEDEDEELKGVEESSSGPLKRRLGFKGRIVGRDPPQNQPSRD